MIQPLRNMRLRTIRYAGHLVNTYEFVPLDGEPMRHFGPGTHIDLEVQEGWVRQYSLVQLRQDAYVIAVQRESTSRGGSSHLHDVARVGDCVRAGNPRNLFELDETAPHSMLIAGGIGIAPMLPMVARLKALNASWELHYAWRTGDAPFIQGLRCHADKVTFAIHDAAGYQRIDIPRLVAEAHANTAFYCCGPASMLESFNLATAGLPETCVHVERFAPTELPSANGGYVVVLERSGREITVMNGQTILQALLEHGIDAPHSCEQGICGTCETGIVSGVADHRDGILSPGERAANKTMMICCSGSAGPKLVLDL